MGAVVPFVSSNQQRLREDFLRIAKQIEIGDINVNDYSPEALRRFHELARNRAVNFEKYLGEAQRCLEQLEGAECYRAFDNLVCFCIRVVYHYSDQHAV